MELASLQYPIGRADRRQQFSTEERERFIDRLAAQPAALRAVINSMTSTQLDTPYRPEGWTVRQLVHHVPDSHVNFYIRVKLALTEHQPTVKPYDQDKWATLADIDLISPDVSLAMFEATHARVVPVLRAMSDSDFARRLHHPENGPMTIDNVLALYAWHGDHHIAQIRGLRERSGW